MSEWLPAPVWILFLVIAFAAGVVVGFTIAARAGEKGRAHV
jgi:hypothetical protein